MSDAGSDASAPVERLQRQLTELECLEAMYPREGSGSGFRSLNPDALDAARAAVDGWERSGEPPGADALAAIPPLRCSLTLDLEEDAETSRPAETLTLRVTLPRRYPAVAPTIEAAGSATSRDAAGAILSRLDRIAEERTTALGEEGGAECLAELAQEARELAEADANATRRAAAAAASERDARDAPNALHHAVVRIDHMNDSSGYVKKLRKWAAALGLAVRLFYAEEGRGATATATATATAPADEDDSDDRPPSGGRVEGVFVVLAGEDDAIGGFLARLRTEMVDVDSRGAKCRERKSEVLCRRRAGEVKAGERAVPAFAGFACAPYRGSGGGAEGDAIGGLERCLAGLNLLHVGGAGTRYRAWTGGSDARGRGGRGGREGGAGGADRL